jgi:hypothetical protein
MSRNFLMRNEISQNLKLKSPDPLAQWICWNVCNKYVQFSKTGNTDFWWDFKMWSLTVPFTWNKWPKTVPTWQHWTPWISKPFGKNISKTCYIHLLFFVGNNSLGNYMLRTLFLIFYIAVLKRRVHRYDFFVYLLKYGMSATNCVYPCCNKIFGPT